MMLSSLSDGTPPTVYVVYYFQGLLSPATKLSHHQCLQHYFTQLRFHSSIPRDAWLWLAIQTFSFLLQIKVRSRSPCR